MVKLVTDGEYNRQSWHRDFMLKFENVRMVPSKLTVRFHDAAGESVATFPSVLVQSPESAARELVATLRKRRSPRVVTGFATRQLVRLQQLVSRKTAINMMGRNSPL